MVRTGSDEGERSNPGGVSSHPDEAGHPMAVGPMAAVAGSGEAGEGSPRVAVPAGELGRAGDAFPLGTSRASESADVHAESTGQPAKEAGRASVGPVTSADVVSGLVVARGEVDADSVGADSAAATEGAALPAGIDEGAVEVATLAAAPPQEVGGRVESGLPPKPRRISNPMLVAAAIAGMVLTAVPFALGGLGGHGSPRGAGADAAAFSSGGGSSSGFVPSAEAGIPMPSTGVVAPPASQPPAAQPPAAVAPAAAAPAPAAPAAPPAESPTPPAPAPAPPPPSTSSATSANVKISGQVSCTSGRSVEGVWVAAAQGSGFAPWRGLGNGSTSDYWYTLPISEPYSLHVGCGGTTANWAVAAYSPQVSGTQNSFNCIDVAGQPGYKTCVAR
jgi:hypothetical protein